MTVAEMAEMLRRDYGVYEALNLDGGGSTTLAMADPHTGRAAIINTPNGAPRAVGSSLAIFAAPVSEPPLLILGGVVFVVAYVAAVVRRK